MENGFRHALPEVGAKNTEFEPNGYGLTGLQKIRSPSPMVANYVSTKLYSHLFCLKINPRDLIKLNKDFNEVGDKGKLMAP